MKAYFFLFSVFCASILFAQQNQDAVILKVNDREVSASEFKSVYTKNASVFTDDDKMSVEDYFELFKKYQLKLEAAFQLGLDEDSEFLKEYKKYYKQLADNYIANGEVTDEMVKETYNRIQTEVKASHILISVKPNATESQKEEALQKAQKLIEELHAGADFESLAKKHSDDPSAQVNAGNIGWFRAFKMVYPFEEAVYHLETNEISAPVETQFGYHIIKKTGERKSIGKIKIAHIMVRAQQQDTTKTPADRIQEIYKKIENGEDFQDLAKQFSQDENTAENGGVMPAFELGSINSPTFEEVAFSLNKNGQVSKPFETRFGWHIIKRLGTEPLASFEEQKDQLKRRIKTSERSKLLNDRIQAKLSEYHTTTANPEAIAFLASHIDDDLLKSQWKLKNPKAIPNKVYLTIDDSTFSWLDLAEYIEKQQRAAKNNSSKKAKITELANNFVYANLVEHHKKNLPDIDPEFAASIQEYKHGLLLYEVMDRQVWSPAKEDSIALRKHYQQNKSNYKTDETIDVEMVNFTSKKQAKRFLKKVKSQDDFATKAETSNEAIFQQKEAKPTNASAIAPNLKLVNGISKIYKHNGQYVIYNIHQVNPVRQLAFDEVKGRVISDYQDELEKQWLADLLKKHELVVNQNVLNSIKKEFE